MSEYREQARDWLIENGHPADNMGTALAEQCVSLAALLKSVAESQDNKWRNQLAGVMHDVSHASRQLGSLHQHGPRS